MKPYYQESGVTIYCGDARDLVSSVAFAGESVITDPVWPNSVFPDVEDPQRLLAEVLSVLPADVQRLVVHLGCDSDPRFLAAVPSRFRFFRFCSLEYAQCGYKGRVLVTGDIAYVFGVPPAARPGAMVLPGKKLSTGRLRYVARGTGRTKNKRLQAEAYTKIGHPCPRDLEHVQWLVKWFAGTSVCDPFMGIGTTAIACKALGVPFVGFEIREDFCDIAIERLSQEVFDLTSDATSNCEAPASC